MYLTVDNKKTNSGIIIRPRFILQISQHKNHSLESKDRSACQDRSPRQHIEFLFREASYEKHAKKDHIANANKLIKLLRNRRPIHVLDTYNYFYCISIFTT